LGSSRPTKYETLSQALIHKHIKNYISEPKGDLSYKQELLRVIKSQWQDFLRRFDPNGLICQRQLEGVHIGVQQPSISMKLSGRWWQWQVRLMRWYISLHDN